jgi:hypothetical protein
VTNPKRAKGPTERSLPPNMDAPSRPVQRWLITHKYTGGVLGTVRDQFAFGARRKSGPELHIDVDIAEVVSVGDTPEDTRELAASLGLRMHEDIVAEASTALIEPATDPKSHTITPPTDIGTRLTALEKRLDQTIRQLANLERAVLRSRRRNRKRR